MAYTPATKLPSLLYAQWSRPGAPNPRLASPVAKGVATLTFTAPLLDHTGSVPTKAFRMGIRDSVTSYVEICYVPANGLSADGLTASGVVRGGYLEGTDFTTGNAALSIDLGPDSAVYLDVDPVLFNLMILAMQGLVASGGTLWRIGDLTNVDIKVAAANGDANEPFFEYSAAQNQWVFSNDGVSSTPFGTGAGVTGGAGITVLAGVISVNLADTTDFVTVSSGAADAGKVARLNASGQYNAGFINALSASIVTTKGDLIAATGNAAIAREGVGSDEQVYIADSSVSTGHRWGVVPLTSANYKHGAFQRIGNAASGSQTIAHGLGKTPAKVRFTAFYCPTGASQTQAGSQGAYNGSTTSTTYFTGFSGSPGGIDSTNIIHLIDTVSAASQVATITTDATNLTLTWTLTGAMIAEQMNILWEVEG